MSVTPNIFSKSEKLKDSLPILFIRKINSSHKGVSLSHLQNKWNNVSGDFLQKKQFGESALPILWRNLFVQMALWNSLK